MYNYYASEQAQKALWAYLTPYQKRTWRCRRAKLTRQARYITVRGSMGGRYKIAAWYDDDSPDIFKYEQREWRNFCFEVYGGLPLADEVLALKLLIEGDEEALYRAKNWPLHLTNPAANRPDGVGPNHGRVKDRRPRKKT